MSPFMHPRGKPRVLTVQFCILGTFHTNFVVYECVVFEFCGLRPLTIFTGEPEPHHRLKYVHSFFLR